MSLLTIPLALFEELSAEVGRGEEYQGLAKLSSLGGDEFRLREIDPEKYFGGEGIVGVIGYAPSKRDGESHYFAIWTRKPEGDLDSIGEPEAFLKISAGMELRFKHEIIRGEFGGYYRGDLTNYLMPLVALVLKRANELTVTVPA